MFAANLIIHRKTQPNASLWIVQYLIKLKILTKSREIRTICLLIRTHYVQRRHLIANTSDSNTSDSNSNNNGYETIM